MATQRPRFGTRSHDKPTVAQALADGAQLADSLGRTRYRSEFAGGPQVYVLKEPFRIPLEPGRTFE
jgi:hypothetical protein